MERNKKRKYVRLLEILGVLWLIAGYLAGLSGCGAVQQSAISQAAEDRTAAETTVVQESAAVPETTAVSETTAAPESVAVSETTTISESIAEIAGTAQGTFEETRGEKRETLGEADVQEQGFYTSKEEVALYIHLYGHLPDNYITKREAENLGWNSKEGNLWQVAPGMSIGGSRFGNYEGALPDEEGRKYYECDIDFEGGYRGAKRIIYSDDGLIFYTEDHYKTFEQLYGE